MADKKTLSAKESKKTEKVYETEKKSKGEKYFKTDQYAGIKILVSGPEVKNPTLLQYAKFIVVKRKELGYDKSTGYLKTSEAKLIKVCESKGYIVEIDKDEYEKAVGK